MGLRVLKTPVRCPQADAFCERLIGTIRCECLDGLIVLSERHLRSVLQEWVAHYHRGRPHASLGPGIPDVPLDKLARPNGHRILDGHESWPLRSWRGCIMNIAWNRWQREP